MPIDTSGLELAARERLVLELYEVRLRAGYVLRLANASLPVQHQGVTWYAAPGLRRGAIDTGIDLKVDSTSIAVPNRPLQLGGRTRSVAHWAMVRAFDAAQVTIRTFDYRRAVSVVQSVWRVQSVLGASVTQVEFGLESPIADLDRAIPRVLFSAQCQNTLGDRVCAVDLAQFAATSTVAAATLGTVTYGTLTPSTPPVATDYGDGYFDLGHVRFDDGALAGLEAHIMAHTAADQTLHLFAALPEVPDAGSAITITPGCHGTLLDCRDKFGDLRDPLRTDWRRHFLGFPYAPDMEAILL